MKFYLKPHFVAKTFPVPDIIVWANSSPPPNMVQHWKRNTHRRL
jgi:hypothetical protein